MAGFTRKKLKQDKFTEEVTHGVEYIAEHRKKVLTIVVAAIVAVVATLGWISYSRSRAEQARIALLDAVQKYHGVVDTEERVGYITYATTIERFREVTAALEEVMQEYAGRPGAATAEYYLALLEAEQEKFDEARQRLAGVIEKADAETQALARLALADLLARAGQTEEARQHLQTLVNNPTRTVPKERAQLALARALAESDPEEAKTILQELMAKPGPVSVAAGVTLRQIEGA